jgi:primosomal protein N' (replication factor Y)
MYNDELEQRKKFKYPPFQRLIHFTMKHRDRDKLNEGAREFVQALKAKFGERVLGPDFPVISRIKNQYIKNAMLKVEREISVKKTRELIMEVKNNFEALSEFKSVKITIDVDPM